MRTSVIKVEDKPIVLPIRKGGEGDLIRSKRTLVICDFDGTACSVDMGNMILARFAGTGWREIDRAYNTDEIGSCVAYTKVASLFRGSKGQMVEYVHNHAALDPYFADFTRFCTQFGFDIKIASDGLDFYISAVLNKHGLADIEFFSNAVTFYPGEIISISFPHINHLCGRCGTCKTNILKGLSSYYERIIYIGDSYSDVCPAKIADLVFAKHILYDKCRKNGTACIPYKNFRDVMDYLVKLS